MKIRTILDGNAFYEIDEECMEQRKRKRAGNMQRDVLKTEQVKSEAEEIKPE